MANKRYLSIILGQILLDDKQHGSNGLILSQIHL